MDFRGARCRRGRARHAPRHPRTTDAVRAVIMPGSAVSTPVRKFMTFPDDRRLRRIFGTGAVLDRGSGGGDGRVRSVGATDTQRLQLVGLYRSGRARGVHQGDRHQGQLRHLRLQRHAGDQAAGRQIRLRRRGADRPISSNGRSRPASSRNSTRPSCRTSAMSGRRSPSGSRPTIPATSTPSITCGARPASATTSGRRRSVLGDTPIDSWDIVFKPEILAKFKDCGVHMLDSSDDILAAALHYLGLDPNTTKQADLEKAADLVTKVRPERAQVPFVGISQRAGDRRNLFRRRLVGRHQAGAEARRGGQERRRDRLRDSEGGRADVLRQFRDSEGRRRTSPRRTRSSTICCGPTWRRRIRISSAMPTAISRARS